MLVAILGFLVMMVIMLTFLVFYLIYRVNQLEDCVSVNADLINSFVDR